jgi:hypothetical protein
MDRRSSSRLACSAAAWTAFCLAVVPMSAQAPQGDPKLPPPPAPGGGVIKVERFSASRPAEATWPDRDRAPTPSIDHGGPPRAADFFPLGAGAQWTWETTTFATDQPATKQEERAEVLLDDVAVKGGVCSEIRLSRGGAAAGFEYLGAREDGVYRHPNLYLGGLRGVGANAPKPVLKDPIRVGASWSYVAHRSVQTMGNAPRRPRKDLEYTVTGTIEALDEPVETSHGRSLCLRLRTETRGAGGDFDVVSWHARAVGLVKSAEGPPGFDAAAGVARKVKVLISRAPPTPFAERDAGARLIESLSVHPRWMVEGGAPVRVSPLDVGPFRGRFRARFFVVEKGDGSRRAVFFVSPVTELGPRLSHGDMGELDALMPGGWNALIARDVFKLDDGLDGSQAAEELARALAVAYAAQKGATFKDAKLPDGSDSEVSIAADGTQIARVATVGRLPDGESLTFILSATIKDKKLIAAAVE